LVSELETLQNEFDTVQESSRMDIDGFERLLSDLETVIEQLGFDHEQMRTALDLAQQTNASLLSQAAKSRAQLAGGRAKGALLIERYQERLRLAIETIQTLRNQAEPSANENRRAA
jgi:exonuclease VII small subunit